MLCLDKTVNRLLVIAIGGGGDIASAAMIARSFEKRGLKTVLASIAWERYVYDPVPGPVRLEEIYGVVRSGEGYVVINGDSYAIRGGRKLFFQAINASRFLGREIYIVDMYNGVEGYVKAIKEIMSENGVDMAMAIDVGGDIVAMGFEENLWSPLADWMGLAAVSEVGGLIAVHSPGSDGELSHEYVLRRIDEISAMRGLVGVKLMCEEDAVFLEEILRFVKSEASYISLLAYRGFRGIREIRNGSRQVNVNLFSTMTFILRSNIVLETVKPASMIKGTKSIFEANNILNKLGIYTELDLEMDLASHGYSPGDITSDVLVNIRRKGIEKLRSTAFKNPENSD
ncbi:MAG: DUF1152 domain-containing protein [Desulfurococcaceae archaeon]